jgi:hypothetical protein
MRNAYKFWLGSLKGRIYLEDLGIVGRIILKFILKKQSGRVWTRLMCLRIGEHKIKLQVLEGQECLDELYGYQLLMKDSAVLLASLCCHKFVHQGNITDL